jgi:hypothetical protein
MEEVETEVAAAFAAGGAGVLRRPATEQQQHLGRPEADLAARMRGLRERATAQRQEQQDQEEQQQQQPARQRRRQQHQQQQAPLPTSDVLRVSSGLGPNSHNSSGSIATVARAALRRLRRADPAEGLVVSAAGGDAALRALRVVAALSSSAAVSISAPRVVPVVAAPAAIRRSSRRCDSAFELRVRLAGGGHAAAASSSSSSSLCCRPPAELERAGAVPCGGGGVSRHLATTTAAAPALEALLPVVRPVCAEGVNGDAAAPLATAVAEARRSSPLGGCAVPLARGKHAARALEAVALLAREFGPSAAADLRLEVRSSSAVGAAGAGTAAAPTTTTTTTTTLYIYARP